MVGARAPVYIASVAQYAHAHIYRSKDGIEAEAKNSTVVDITGHDCTSVTIVQIGAES